MDVVVVTHNSAHLLDELHLRLKRLGPQLVIADSGSTDGTVGMARDLKMRTLELPNLGFGTACNRGAALGNADIIAFLNPDAAVTVGQLNQLSSAMRSAHVHAIAPRLVDQHGDFTSLGTDHIRPPWRRRLRRQPIHLPTSLQACQTVTGAVLVMRRDSFEYVNGFDEGFFLYAEEDDLLRRMADSGSVLVVAKDVHVAHVGEGSSSGIDSGWRTAQRFRGRRRYIGKHYGRVDIAAETILSTARLIRLAKGPSDALRLLSVYLTPPK